MTYYEIYPDHPFDCMDDEEIAWELGITVEELKQPLTMRTESKPVKHYSGVSCGDYESKILAEQENSGMYD